MPRVVLVLALLVAPAAVAAIDLDVTTADIDRALRIVRSGRGEERARAAAPYIHLIIIPRSAGSTWRRSIGAC